VLGGFEHVVVSPDARRAYAILEGFPAVTVMAHLRDPQTGRITPTSLPAGCVTLGSQSDNCGLAPAIPGPYWDGVMSPDGRFLDVLAAGAVVALMTQ
jgi:hypothetical protein